jgi:hypothetical protein
VIEPGLDRHEWESQWQALEEDLETSPLEALPEVDRLIESILINEGFPVHDPVADDGIEPEILVAFRDAHRVARQVADGESVDLGDVAAAIHAYRDLYTFLLEDRRAP